MVCILSTFLICFNQHKRLMYVDIVVNVLNLQTFVLSKSDRHSKETFSMLSYVLGAIFQYITNNKESEGLKLKEII